MWDGETQKNESADEMNRWDRHRQLELEAKDVEKTKPASGPRDGETQHEGVMPTKAS